MNWIFSFLGKGSFFALFVLVSLEYACFPVPSEVVLPFVGFVAGVNNYSLFGTIFLSVIVSYFGCLICYLVGYYGGAYLYEKIYNKFIKWRKGLDVASYKFKKYGNLSVLLCRLIPLCRTYISFFAGIFKQSLFSYSFYSIIGIFIWNTILISLGYFLLDKWRIVSDIYNQYKFVLLFFIIIVICLILLYKVHKKRKNVKNIIGD